MPWPFRRAGSKSPTTLIMDFSLCATSARCILNHITLYPHLHSHSQHILQYSPMHFITCRSWWPRIPGFRRSTSNSLPLACIAPLPYPAVTYHYSSTYDTCQKLLKTDVKVTKWRDLGIWRAFPSQSCTDDRDRYRDRYDIDRCKDIGSRRAVCQCGQTGAVRGWIYLYRVSTSSLSTRVLFKIRIRIIYRV